MAIEKQRKTFLSYSRINQDFAKRLAKELKSEGFDLWFDQMDIPAGARWDREVERALKECEIFMIIMTPASVDSENVLDEIGYAIDTGKQFLPVLLENCEVPFRLRRFQYVDFTNKDFDDGVESAKQLLRGLITQTTIPREQVTDDTQALKKKAELDRKAQENAERIAKKVADEELAAKTKAETERKAKEEADRLATQKAEADKLAKQKAEDERLTKAKAEEKVVPVEDGFESKITSVTQKKPISKGLVIGILVVAVLAIAGFGFSALSSQNTLKPTSTPTPMPIFLNSKDVETLFNSGYWTSLFLLATEQYTSEEFGAFFTDTGVSGLIPITLNESKPIGLDYAWCASDSNILQDNLDDITFIFEFNGSPIPERNITSYYYSTEGGECFQKLIAIDEWTTGVYYVSFGLRIDQALNNGQDVLDAGNSTSYNFEVTVP